MTNDWGGVDRNRGWDRRRIERCAQRFITPGLDRFVHLVENGELAAA